MGKRGKIPREKRKKKKKAKGETEKREKKRKKKSEEKKYSGGLMDTEIWDQRESRAERP